ncbi:hypothetical protein LX16_1094 [Stackebrandtia albiflava]|uniref:Uncharacterized protein n=1 Tax=Stackebrandtia albiflava TaxID=406432 RepID=A0A562VC51_9ACTN|nr:hypothetical protein [Stackebrandtia albiflava]TWJ15391.1 hypothetical protein LX16_1094 [Stackebrandtia albiflava]
MVDGAASRGRGRFLNVAVWVTVAGVLCAVAAAVSTTVGGMEGVVRAVGFTAMVCAVVSGAGAVMHSLNGAKALYATAAVATFIAGSTFFGMSFSA